MEEILDKRRERNPRDTAGLFSFLTFFYTIPIFRKGLTKELTEDDLYETLVRDKSSILGHKTEKLWKIEFKKYRQTNALPSFKNVLMKQFRTNFILIGIGYGIVEILCKPAQLISLGYIISYYMKGSNMKDSDLYLYVASLLLFTLLAVFVQQWNVVEAYHIGMEVRIAATALIYRKTLKLNQSAFRHISAGQMINLLSNDVAVYDRYIALWHYNWIVPMQVAFYSHLMYLEIGIFSVIGVCVLIALVPLQMFFGKLSAKYRFKTATRTDARIRLMDEIIRGIKIIKMYAWEKYFTKLAESYRKLEIKSITTASYIKSISATYFIYTAASLFLTLTFYMLFGNNIDARKVFYLTSAYNTLGFHIATFFTQAIATTKDAAVSSTRILNFLLLDESEQQCSDVPLDGISVRILNATAKWNEELPHNTLTNLNIDMKQGALIAIVGSVGSGKSSLLQCILKELSLVSGDICVNGSISYANQEPWIFTGSVGENILLKSKMNVTRYQAIVNNCALTTDFKLLPYGDKTIVGERGALLSGGQKARINLARAIYRDADIYLLDDPFSAVDIKVGRQIFEQCICGYLRKKTVILVTHQLQYLQQVDWIIVMENGSVKAQGSFDDLQICEFISKYDSAQNKTTDNDNININSVETLSGDAPSVEKEQISTGSVSTSVYVDYIAACGNYPLVLFAGCLFMMAQLCFSGFFYFMAFWVSLDSGAMDANHQLNNSTIKELTTQHLPNSVVYGIITIAVVLITLMRNTMCYHICMKSSTQLHNSMFKSVLSASMQFFNTNPSGRILNRFTKDLGTVDELLPTTILLSIQTILSLFGAMIINSVVSPILIVPSVLLVVSTIYLTSVYLSSSLSIKRLEGTTKSPVFGHLNATVQGLSTIRAFNAQNTLTSEFDSLQDLHSCSNYLFIITSRAFACWLDFLCFTYVACNTLFFVLTDDDASSENVGLVITQAMQLMTTLQWGLRQLTEMANNMTSVERVLEYNSIEHERSFESSPNVIAANTWPKQGNIIFDKVSLSYSQTKSPVLKDLSFIIQPRQKIGIVGRTGSGKSSLIAAIFQLVPTEGSIIIDDMNIKNVGLHDLRPKISIIPQDPVIFAGSVRKNLDPFDEYTDEVLWKSLEDVKLKEAINGLESGLHSEISEGGSNLSVGQRQLICLARAMLRNNEILILDEATANVDTQTDAVIQETVREKFANCTILTVAHRLQTILDSDRVLVMDAGEIIEFDHPKVLLQISYVINKICYRMCIEITKN